jgi:NAD(P)-dependent dehydrogenase (short-subunit alcohol dehydrogenase family)
MGQEDKLVLITGATEGVGKQTAIQLAEKGFNIVMMVRNKAKAEQTIKEISAKAPSAKVDYILVDLTSFKQVRAAAKKFNEKYDKLDVLINNAGLMYPEKVITEDGFELCFQTNHLSHFLLTHLVLDKLKKSKQGRIINLSSEGHKMGKFDPDNFNAEKGYGSVKQYCFTKLCNLYFTYCLAEKLQGTNITVNAVHPGVVKSGFGSDLDKGLLKPIFSIARLFMITNEQGAATSVFLASDPGVSKITGKYFKNSKETRTNSLTHNQSNQQILWDYSVEKVGLKKLEPAI